MSAPGTVAAALAAAGVARLFLAPGVDPALVAAVTAHGAAAIACPDERIAGLAAAATADLGDAPGAVAVAAGRGPAAAPALAHALLERSPLLLLGPAREEIPAPLLKAAVAPAVAASLALAEPAGPVLADPTAPSLPPTPRVPGAGLTGEALAAAARALAGATRPVLIAGRGCRSPAVAAWLRAFAEALPAPVAATVKGKGALPDPHPLALGLVGDPRLRGPVLAQADLVVLLGVDALEAVPWEALPGAPALHVAPWPVAGPRRSSSTELRGEVGAALEELAPRLRMAERADWDLAALDRVKRALDAPPAGDALARLVADARELTPAGTVATADPDLRPAVTATWAATAPGELFVPDTAPSAGFALAAALAAGLARPAARVLAFVDPPAVVTAAAALEALVRLGLRVTVVVAGAPGPPVGDVARAVGLVPLEADGVDQARPALARALAAPGPGLVWTAIV